MKKLFHPDSNAALWWIHQAIVAVPAFIAPCLEFIDSYNTDCTRCCKKKASSCVFRYFPEPGVSCKWTSSSVSHGGRSQGGSARQTPHTRVGRSQRGDSEGPTPVQRGQHRPASATAAPNLRRVNVKSQRKPAVYPVAGNPWLPQMVMPPAVQAQPQYPHQPPQSVGGSNLVKMAHMARSTPQLDDYTDNRDRERIREREKPPQAQNTRESLIPQVTG